METSDTVTTTIPLIGERVHVVTGPNGSGKTRYLTAIADKVSEELRGGGSSYSRLICLCGAVHDRFSRRVYSSSTYYGDCVYLGYRTSHNMFSEIAPYRKLFGYLINGGQVDVLALEASGPLLADFGLSPTVKVYAATGGKRPRHYTIDFSNNRVDFADRLESLESPRFVFERQGSDIELRELSSGERWYLLLLLSASIFMNDRCLLMIDEPENSLHPEWQLSVIKRIDDIAHQKGIRYTALISTHSPLIVASAPNGSLFCDLAQEPSWRPERLHGQTTDYVLSERFGLVSPRSPEVTNAIQKCLTLIAHRRTSSDEFRQAFSELESYNLALETSDPLYETYNTIVRIARNA